MQGKRRHLLTGYVLLIASLSVGFVLSLGSCSKEDKPDPETTSPTGVTISIPDVFK